MRRHDATVLASEWPYSGPFPVPAMRFTAHAQARTRHSWRAHYARECLRFARRHIRAAETMASHGHLFGDLEVYVGLRMWKEAWE